MINRDVYLKDLEKWEGYVPYLYCDKIGLVTIGVGNLVYREAVVSLPLFTATKGKGKSKSDVPATDEQKLAAWDAVKAAFTEEAPRPSDFYKWIGGLLMGKEACFDLAVIRVERDFVPAIAKVCPGFYSFPQAAQRAILDIAYNCGVKGFFKFQNLIAACNRGDWRGAMAHCHRSTSREERNKWVADLFRSLVK